MNQNQTKQNQPYINIEFIDLFFWVDFVMLKYLYVHCLYLITGAWFDPEKLHPKGKNEIAVAVVSYSVVIIIRVLIFTLKSPYVIIGVVVS
jgi:hypothetical protein